MITLSFDDVLLVPQYNTVKSRSQVHLSTRVGATKVSSPIIGANMPSICGPDMCTALSSEGALGIVHRMCTVEEQVAMVRASDGTVGAAIGIGDDWRTRASSVTAAGASVVCLDVAHGSQERVTTVANEFLDLDPRFSLIIGNLATAESARILIKGIPEHHHHRIALKAGVGGGSVCLTRIRTGFGVPTLTSVMDIAATIEELDSEMSLIADGGIKNSGDICKSLAAGADAVMIGSLLAGTDESPGDVVKNGDQMFKMYAGSASYGAKKKFFGKAEYVEGAERLVPYKGSAVRIIQSLHEGIRSGFTYGGADCLEEFQVNAEFIQISAAGYRESIPHGLL